MTAPRLEIDLDKIHHNARTLVERLGIRGIGVTGVTKATLGSPEIARQLVHAGVTGLGDSRIENIEAMRRARIPTSMTLIRSPMISQVRRVVEHADRSCNTELDVLRALSAAARATDRRHGIVLMIELGDLREGIAPHDLEPTVRELRTLPNLVLAGVGTNLACQNGVAPDAAKMAELSDLASSIERTFGITLDVISGGNSANLDLALGGGDLGRINDLRLGESILLGRETLHRRPIEGLFTDAITLVAEVIEAKVKPSLPWGTIGQAAFGPAPAPVDRGDRRRLILALGHQDTDPAGLTPPPGLEIVGASSDHVVLDAGRTRVGVGAEVTLQLDYSALVRAMTSPFVTKVIRVQSGLAARP